ncbi:RidA family protein [Sorangium sp. So ce1014]|uniref:RidA family protein n=1 Tax=Sorangium sp. So ce1014 TaxID=3133326 RepID=UPI003F60828F
MERKNYSALGDPVGPYVHAVKHNGFLFLSGLTAFGSPAQKGSVAEQAEAIFSQIASIARAEQVGLEAIAKVTIFVTSFDDIAALRETLFRIYGAALPASSLVRVAGLFSSDLRIEVEAVLAIS